MTPKDNKDMNTAEQRRELLRQLLLQKAEDPQKAPASCAQRAAA